MNRVKELTLKYIDADIADEEIEELESLVASDPDARALHISLLEQEAVLRGGRVNLNLAPPTLAKIREEVSHRIEDRVMASIQEGTPRSPRLLPFGRRFRRVAAGIAALFVVLIGIQTIYMAAREPGEQETFLYGNMSVTPGTLNAFRVYVQNGKTKEPIFRAEVHLMLLNEEEGMVWETETTTDPNGIARI